MAHIIKMNTDYNPHIVLHENHLHESVMIIPHRDLYETKSQNGKTYQMTFQLSLKVEGFCSFKTLGKVHIFWVHTGKPKTEYLSSKNKYFKFLDWTMSKIYPY